MMNIVENRVSEHFSLKELTQSALALRHGIPNIPSPQVAVNLTNLAANILEPTRRYFNIPFSPSSGYRAAAVNRLAGSKSTSQHLTGHAVDFEIPTIPNGVLVQWMKKNLIFDQLILEFYHRENPESGWVHCSYVGDNNRNICLVFDGKNYTKF